METQENNLINDEKRKKWDTVMSELNAYPLNRGEEGADVPVDEEIKECLAAMNVLGMQTTASCGGHPEDEGLGFPMVQGILENDIDGSRSSREAVQLLLDEFNVERSTPFILYLHPEVTDGFRIESMASAEGERMMVENEEGYDGEKMKSMKLGAQKEFQAFTEFLKRKTFGDA